MDFQLLKFKKALPEHCSGMKTEEVFSQLQSRMTGEGLSFKKEAGALVCINNQVMRHSRDRYASVTQLSFEEVDKIPRSVVVKIRFSIYVPIFTLGILLILLFVDAFGIFPIPNVLWIFLAASFPLVYFVYWYKYIWYFKKMIANLSPK